MSTGMNMTRARAIVLMKSESAFYRAFANYAEYADALDIAVADMEKVRRRQKLMKRALIRRAKARKAR